MNVYVVTEGNESEVYKSWIPLINPNLSCADQIELVDTNNFFIVSAGGYPNYFSVIENAIEDIKEHPKFSRLVIGVDSEDMTREDKYAEIQEFVSRHTSEVDVRIVVQHFCFEAWCLGNRKIVRRNPNTRRLRDYKTVYDVRLLDPELLPDKLDEGLNRAQFAAKYLRLAIQERHKQRTYNKNNNRVVSHPKYFDQVRKRCEETPHIASFSSFLEAFS